MAFVIKATNILNFARFSFSVYFWVTAFLEITSHHMEITSAGDFYVPGKALVGISKFSVTFS